MYVRTYESPSSLVTLLIIICAIVFGFFYKMIYGSGYAGMVFIPLIIVFLLVDFIVNTILVVIFFLKNRPLRNEGWLLFLPPLAPLACGLFLILTI